MMKRKLFITLLFSFIAFVCFSYKTNAQGWSFTFQLYGTGDCGGVQSPPITIPNLHIPTKSQCESLRQMVLTYKVSSENCTFGYTCTPCTGSDIASNGSDIANGQSSPGDVSFDGQFLGKPLFTPHQSQAFEDWATGYKQQLASYGITSILGKNITPHQIPLTGNINFDKFYYSQSATFNPSTPTNNLSNQDASVVDLRGKQGTVQLLRNDDDVKKEDEWLKEQGLDNLKTIPNNGILDPIADIEPAPFWTSEEMIDLYVKSGKFLLLFTGEGVIATVIKKGVSFSSEYRAIKDVFDGREPKGTKIISVNTIKKSLLNDVLIKSVGQAIGSTYGEDGKIIYTIAVNDAKAAWGVYKYTNNDNH